MICVVSGFLSPLIDFSRTVVLYTLTASTIGGGLSILGASLIYSTFSTVGFKTMGSGFGVSILISP